MRAIVALMFLPFAVLLTGCAAHPDPIIDRAGVSDEAFGQDWDECESYTEEVQVTKGIAKGTATGATIGAVAGAIGGNSSDVAEGAGFGGLYGGTRSGLDADEQKQMVFKRCMRGRGFRVLN